MKKLLLWGKRVWDRAETLGLRRVIVIGAIALFLLLPTFLAFLHIYISDNTVTVFQSDKIRAELYTEDGVLIQSEEAATDYVAAGSLVEFLQTMNSTKIKTAKTVKELADLTWITAVLTDSKSTLRFTCYFSLAANDSYCVDESGAVYRVEQSLCDHFFSHSYSEPFYEQASLPALTTSNGETVLPNSVEWFYKNWDQQYVSATLSPTTEERALSYDMPGALSLSFASEPDLCTVEVSDRDGTLLYAGSYKNLDRVVGEPARMTVTANWTKRENGTCYGSASYEFAVQIRDRAVFELNRTQVRKGSAVLLSCANIFDPSRLRFSVLGEAKEHFDAPVFYSDGTRTQAFLVFPADMAEDSLTFSVTYGATAERFTVSLLPAAIAEDYTIEGDGKDLWRDALREWERFPLPNLVAAPVSPQSNLLYSADSACLPLGRTDLMGYGYGADVFRSGSTQSFVSPGVEYLSVDPNGQSVAAVKSGLVIDRGYSEFLGNYVVVEHGLGLRTWYCHLRDAIVSVGSYVRYGETLGHTGSCATASADGVLLLCTIGDNLLNPAFLFDKQ